MTNPTEAQQTEYKDLVTQHSAHYPKVGDTITGTVVSVSKNEVQVDIGGYAVGAARGYELIDESGEYSDLNIGDEVVATVLDLENELGTLELSFRSAGHKKAWDNLKVLQESGEMCEAKIIEANKGGLMVTIGKTHGFLPVSQLCPEHYPRIQGGDKAKILDRLKMYVGEMFEVKVIDVNEADNKLIVSEKAAWEVRQKDVISKYKVGDIVEGKATVITDFGVFVEFGDGLEGLVHISELAWQRIEDPKDVVRSGQEVKAQIIKIDGSKIFLSMKRLIDDPWKSVTERWSVGQRVKGKVLKINPFGLFVELSPDIHGLAHISELSTKPISDPHEVGKVGEEMEFQIVSIEPAEHRLGLSIKAMHAKKVEPSEKKEEKDEEVKEEAPVEEKAAE